MQVLKLKILKSQFSIHKLNLDQNIPESLLQNRSFFSLTFTDDEKSLICDSNFFIQSIKRDDGWTCIKLISKVAIDVTGIWSKITTICSNSNCPVLTVTTFNTDYFLIKTINLEKLKSNFLENNFIFVENE